jgi:hypothetical protein
MTIADFKTELARLIRKGSTAGLSRDDMVDELTDAAEDLTTKLMRLASLKSHVELLRDRSGWRSDCIA